MVTNEGLGEGGGSLIMVFWNNSFIIIIGMRVVLGVGGKVSLHVL